MAEHAGDSARPTDAVGRALFGIAKFLAIFGGVLVSMTAVMVTVSVTGRYLFAAPIPGDYDLIAIMCGCAVFAFLPYCQMIRGNVVVDFFTTDISPFAKAALDAFGTLLYLLVAILFTWRLVLRRARAATPTPRCSPISISIAGGRFRSTSSA